MTTASADTNINLEINAAGTGCVNLDGNQMPNGAVAQYSILASNTAAGDLSAVTSPNGSDDQIPRFNNTVNTIEWASLDGVVVAFDTENLGVVTDGLFTVTQPFLASVSETISINAIDSIELNGDSSTNTLQIGLGFDGLTLITDPLTEVDPSNDYLAFYDVSDDVHTTIGIDQLFELLPGNDFGQSEATAVGGANESFTGFFTNTPTSNNTITVFFNGVALRQTGWTRTGNDLTLVDSVNGYSTEAGNIISARYNY